MINKKIPRRESLKTLAKYGFVLPIFGAGTLKNIVEKEKNHREIHLFGKHLQWQDYGTMAKTAAEIGFDGVDITVRPKGQVLPENVEKDLPKVVEALHKAGIKAELITTAITNTQSPHTEQILKTANQLGIKYYRMGWMKYDNKTTIPEQLENYKNQLQELAAMNEKYNIHGAYQNHAGTSVGAPIWDIWYLIKDINPQWLGCRYDVRHATVEGMNSWELSLKLLAPHINSLDVKDFVWTKNEDDWKVENVPIGAGAVNFKQYFQLLNDLEINAPITMHYEYPLGGADKGAYEINIPEKEVKTALRRDLEALKSLMNEAQN